MTINKNLPRSGLFALLLVLSTFLPLQGQNEWVKIRILGAMQSQTQEDKVSSANGFGLGAQMNFVPVQRLEFALKVNYDYAYLEQSDVLDEWDWNYWERTYTDFLPGTDATIINQTLLYTSTDSIYSAVFEPTQRLKELRLAAGLEYYLPLSKKTAVFLALDAGMSLFNRELFMHEDWTKRFKVDTLSTTKFDYEYKYRLLHFAPAKKGNRAFIAPGLGTRVFLSSSVDLNFEARYLYYFDREKLFGVLFGSGQDWLPFKSKIQLGLGLTFKY